MKTGIYWQDPKYALGRYSTDPGCVLYLPLHKLNGASFRSKDAYGHLCTVTGALWTPQGRSFDGSDDYVDCGNHSILNFGAGTWSLVVWANVSTDGEHLALLSKALYNDGWVFYIYSNNLRIASHGDYTTLATTETYNDGEWHLFCGQRDEQDDGVLFVDGVEVKRATDFFAGRNVDSTKKLCVGAENEGITKFFKDYIGEVWIYNRALTPIEIQRNYLATKRRYQ